MEIKEYVDLLMPAVLEVAELFKLNEQKYGEGIKLSDNDMLKAMGHAESSINGFFNPDGKTHATATASRALKEVLKELDNG